jgi:hypothetical protein
MNNYNSSPQALEHCLELIFQACLRGQSAVSLFHNLKAKIEIEDMPRLFDFVAKLQDPELYCRHSMDHRTVAGFFAFIDGITWLILEMGQPALERVRQLQLPQRDYVLWIKRYIEDSRFHSEIFSKFGFFA